VRPGPQAAEAARPHGAALLPEVLPGRVLQGPRPLPRRHGLPLPRGQGRGVARAPRQARRDVRRGAPPEGAAPGPAERGLRGDEARGARQGARAPLRDRLRRE
jgi:hypothetical protein